MSGDCKLITYDLRKAGQNYDGLIQKIKNLGVWGKVCESVWVVKTTLSAIQVRDALLSQIDSNDRLFVASLIGETAWINSICGDQWLKEKL